MASYKIFDIFYFYFIKPLLMTGDNYRLIRIISLIWVFLAISSVSVSQGTDSRPLPNIVIIFTDDLGYGDLSCYGAEGYTTPHLDKLAESGIRFTSFYASEAVCSASRASLLTGCYSERVGIRGALSPNSINGLNEKEVTIAEMLKEKKYRTAIIGKWHLGYQRMFLPLQHGFDEYFGLPYSNDMWPVGYDGLPSEGRKSEYPVLMLYDGNRPVQSVETLEEQALLTTLYTERAVEFIEDNHKKPFFLYLAHSMPHVPLGVSDKFSGTTQNGIFGDVISEIDWSVGQVMKTLEKHDLLENTLVIFTSDNGPWLNMGNHAGSAGPLREGKGTAFEGGVREPFIISWPGTIKKGSVSDVLITAMDILPTIADITSAAFPAHRIDGVSFFPLLMEVDGSSPRQDFWYYYNGELRAVRNERWKLIFPHYTISYEGVEPGKDGFPGKYNYLSTGLELYDLSEDIGERHDVADQYPEIVEKMMAIGDKAREDLGDLLNGVSGNGIRQPGRIRGIETKRVNNKAMGMDVSLSVEPNPRYPGKGLKTLVNGIRGSMDFHDFQWLGFQGKDIEVVIDMASPTRVNKISCYFMENQKSWIFLPGEVKIFVSADGVEFEQLGAFTEVIMEKTEASIIEYKVAYVGQKIRYVKVMASNAGPCPVWHPGAGQDSWLFIDEVVVK
jgi:arylsulfatase